MPQLNLTFAHAKGQEVIHRPRKRKDEPLRFSGQPESPPDASLSADNGVSLCEDFGCAP